MLALPGNAQAKIEDMSRLVLNQVSKASNKMPMQVLQQMTSGGNAQPLADMTKKLAVCSCP